MRGLTKKASVRVPINPFVAVGLNAKLNPQTYLENEEHISAVEAMEEKR